MGRHWPAFWRLVGPTVTRRHLNRWLATSGPRLLNLGGGNALFDRWLTADVSPRADVYMDVTAPIPVPDSAIDLVYMEEVIEHIPLNRATALLRECHRILRPGGHLRLTTPSLDYFARRALESADHVGEINSIFYDHGHRHIFSVAELQAHLMESGFVEVKPSSYRDPHCHFGHLDSHAARHAAPAEWSQYWHARKAAAPPAPG
jgi:predicted SAM-dependent methyltransferase